MYNSTLLVDSEGFIVAKTEYNGLIACYLMSNDQIIEKEFYKKRKQHKFAKKPKYGTLSVVFFFKDKNNDIIKYQTKSFIYDDIQYEILDINPKIVIEEPEFKIEYYNQGSNITFITFNGSGTTKDSIPFGRSYVLKNKWNLIAVYQDIGSQYQGIDIEEFYNYVSPLIVNKETFVYGSSLGGYCALYFGGCINATIIAASPRNSAHPSINDPQFSNLSFVHKCFSELPLTKKPVYIVFDSNIPVDQKFIYEQVMKLYSQPNLLALPDASHAVLTTMLSSGVLQLYMSSIICESYNNEIESYIKYKCNKE
ncbi:hypothetical protein ACT3S4_10980 [Psychrobacter sp. AOP30-A2-5]|uniref:hypothetical protein n=1 Tax=Psychrobacter sp. AOP30-A2-5 TaxID=3457697 RepID=UPI0040372596